MHLLGMKAMDLEIPVTYRMDLTVVSAFLAFLPTLAAFLILMNKIPKSADPDDLSAQAHVDAEKRAPHLWILLAAVLIAIGVCAMHYTGMYALECAATPHLRPGIIALSGVVALCAATAAIRFVYILPGTMLYGLPTASVMGLAVCGMHYTGMYGFVYSISVESLAALKISRARSSEIDNSSIFTVFATSACNWVILSLSAFLQGNRLNTLADLFVLLANLTFVMAPVLIWVFV
jgi:NO-binding membrane sensor protein with MHYT domain